jgi:hypothetical protein
METDVVNACFCGFETQNARNPSVMISSIVPQIKNRSQGPSDLNQVLLNGATACQRKSFTANCIQRVFRKGLFLGDKASACAPSTDDSLATCTTHSRIPDIHEEESLLWFLTDNSVSLSIIPDSSLQTSQNPEKSSYCGTTCLNGGSFKHRRPDNELPFWAVN